MKLWLRERLMGIWVLFNATTRDTGSMVQEVDRSLLLFHNQSILYDGFYCLTDSVFHARIFDWQLVRVWSKRLIRISRTCHDVESSCKVLGWVVNIVGIIVPVTTSRKLAILWMCHCSCNNLFLIWHSSSIPSCICTLCTKQDHSGRHSLLYLDSIRIGYMGMRLPDVFTNNRIVLPLTEYL